ncbi:DUF2165 domain-containing protein [Saccharothrix violaceirubra]|uniref:Putative small integral membrane protein n=1 Tax=Saccharothrix violaceirubra TaxID=413306 RepID=A0A7W7T9T0_9PSEU|nr:DUF2165 domain-containing protein [Saccharothrix violaceirubra]MBB4968667.1 putative small integral membrane protein [Saccharothrix violaceirubra]
MRLLGSRRTAVAVLTAVSAVYMVLVVLGNVTDYGTNRAFVEHVLAMDTTFRSPDLMWRAITSPAAVTVAYVAIIVWEAVDALVFLGALVAWIRRDERARALASLGWVMQVLLFGLGFLAIGGEWFAMWQSSTWNGVTAATRNVVIALLGLVLAHLPDRSS